MAKWIITYYVIELFGRIIFSVVLSNILTLYDNILAGPEV